MKNVLVVAAHPDDEIIGPGGTIARHVASGDEVRVLIMGEGQTSRFNDREKVSREILDELHSDTLKAAGVLGVKEVLFEDFPDNRFDSVPMLELAKAVERVIDDYGPHIIYTHHGGDLNVDHRRCLEAVVTATRPMEDCPVSEIYAFPTLSSTEWSFSSPMGGGGAFMGSGFMPNVFIKLSFDDLRKKLEAMSLYRSELREFPHPRSLKMIENEALRWGSVSGLYYAEAFECVRKVII